MSAISKINTLRTFTALHLSLLIAAALIVTLIIAAAGALTSPSAKPIDYNAYMLYRQGEWISVPIRVSNAEAYQVFRRGEVESPVSAAEAYRLFRLSEWTAIPAVDLTGYHLSERTLTDPNAGLSTYLLSERTFVDPQAGIAAYFQSERASVAVRDLTPFNEYQRSEWFGK